MALKRRGSVVLVLSMLTAFASIAIAGPDAKTSDAGKPLASASASSTSLKPKLQIERFTLDNGLRVVLNPDDASPTIAVVVWYDVGSRDEHLGEGGFAHLFEHMMFEGSDKVPRGKHAEIVEGRGGKQNASTSEDWTRYWEMMPASELATTLYLESDRMRSLHVTEEAFENQRKVVKEEYHLRVDNVPYRHGSFRLMELVYEGYHPYAHPAIGSMPELDAAKLEWVKQFHDNYYGPNNAVLVISGDIDVAEAKGLVTKYFAPIARIPQPSHDDAAFTGRSKPSGPESLSDPFARTPAAMFGWTIPKSGDRENYALQIAASVLTDGDSSRLYKRLVKDLGAAQDVSASTADHRGPDAFVIEAQLSDKGKIDDVEREILAAVDALAKKGPTPEELQRARARTEHGFLFGLQTNLSRAIGLATFEGERGDASLLSTESDRLLSVTADEVKAAVAKYLVSSKLAHVRVLPPPKADAKSTGKKG